MRRVLIALAVCVALVAALAWCPRVPSGDAASGPAPARSAFSTAPAIESAPAFRREVANAEADAAASAASTDAPGSHGARIHGRIVYEQDDAPVAGLEMVLFDATSERRCSTGADGRFEVETAAGYWCLGANPGAGRAPWCDELWLQPGEQRDYQHVIAHQGELCVRVWGLLVDRVSPLGGARVTLSEGSSDSLEHTRWFEVLGAHSGSTDFEGRAQVPHASWGPNVVSVTHPGFRPAVVSLDLDPLLSFSPFGQDGCVHVFLERTGPPIRGRVLAPDGAPLADAIVWIDAPFADETCAAVARSPADEKHISPQQPTYPPFARTAPDGSFELASPDPDEAERARYLLVVLPRRAELVQHHVQPLALEDLGRSLTVEVRLLAAEELEIELVDPRGRPLDGVVSVRDEYGFGFAPSGCERAHSLDPNSPGRCLPTEAGRVRLRHPGGAVRVGLSPGGAWRAGEVAATVPPGDASRVVRVILDMR